MQGRDDDLTVPRSEEAFSPLSESGDDAPAADPHAGDGAAEQHSLFDDFETLIDNARTYYEAELTYQKTRAGFVTNRIKATIGYALVAAFFAILATIGLTVGLIIALTPYLTAWGATAAVVLALLLLAFLLVRKAGKAWAQMQQAIAPDDAESGHG